MVLSLRSGSFKVGRTQHWPAVAQGRFAFGTSACNISPSGSATARSMLSDVGVVANLLRAPDRTPTAPVPSRRRQQRPGGVRRPDGQPRDCYSCQGCVVGQDCTCALTPCSIDASSRRLPEPRGRRAISMPAEAVRFCTPETFPIREYGME